METSHCYNLNQPYGEELHLTLKPGMAWAMYVDSGPKGPCGQSMSITCPHFYFYTWPDEESMRKSKIGRNGSKKVIHWGVIGEWGTIQGSFHVS